MTKRTFSLISLAVLALTLTACNKGAQEQTAPAEQTAAPTEPEAAPSPEAQAAPTGATAE
ncbi:MAG: hypothetical protein A2X94_09985 [Bdellovibrionales bacterium GWB1_55_8]|nr:MAG: hypothetical protein A2X94_09985 [Bdellovibrionales bacterium GWB1_55_8]